MSSEPAWFTHAIDQRLAMIEHALKGRPLPQTIIFNPLTEPREGATKAELEQYERTCDHCGKYCPFPKEKFFTGTKTATLSNGTPVFIGFGVCEDCAWS